MSQGTTALSLLQHVADMSGAHFQKLCRDCGLVDSATDITEVDLVFCYVSAGFARVWG